LDVFNGRHAVVTGAGSGIGRSITQRLARDGARVALLGRRAAKLEETCSLMQTEGEASSHLIIPTDIGDQDQVASAAYTVQTEFGGVDMLVNCAGTVSNTPAIDSEFGDWVEPIRVNFLGTVHCCRAFVPLMSEGGRVVNITSIHRDRVEKDGSAYAAAKGALTQYTKALALELADRGILVNAVAPGFVDTPMSIDADGRNELESEWFRSNYVDGHHLPLRRTGNPDEVAGVVAFLVGPDATYICGETITVDGGLTITF
jgi:NAD(P)-dependent dehydrogenase (short-subunit alcohol dehydrogenase family)